MDGEQAGQATAAVRPPGGAIPGGQGTKAQLHCNVLVAGCGGCPSSARGRSRPWANYLARLVTAVFLIY